MGTKLRNRVACGRTILLGAAREIADHQVFDLEWHRNILSNRLKGSTVVVISSTKAGVWLTESAKAHNSLRGNSTNVRLTGGFVNCELGGRI
jgi:hypothetical protein